MSEVRGGDPGEPLAERDRLVVAFVAVAAARGYADLDTAEVCRRAGLAKDAFERHFSDRLSCFRAAWDQLEGFYLERLDSVLEEHAGWRDQLRAGIAETLRLVESNPVAARFLTIETLVAGPTERERQRRLADRLRGLFDRACGQLEDPGTVPEAASEWILAMVFDRIYRHLAAGTENELSGELPQLMFLAVSSLLGAEAGLDEFRSPPP